jgi:hypothetical protein
LKGFQQADLLMIEMGRKIFGDERPGMDLQSFSQPLKPIGGESPPTCL